MQLTEKGGPVKQPERHGPDLSEVPIVIGVTGHRDVPQSAHAQLRETFGRVLERFRTSYPSTPLLVMSALASGADTLAAEEALDRGVRVMAVLPMPVEEYERDFTAEQRDRFLSTLARCWDRVVVPSPAAEHKYVAASAYIAQYSHVVVAFWDGLRGRGPGGTSDVVRLRLTGSSRGADAADIRYVPDVGPVFQIVTPRAGHRAPEESFSVVERYPRRYRHDRTSERDFIASLRSLDQFNKDLSEVPGSPGKDRLLDFRERTAKATNRLQSANLNSLNAMYVLALIAGGAQAVNGDAKSLAYKLPLLGLAFGAFAFARKKDYENRYQDYRAISEGLRVQYAWTCAGMRDRRVDQFYMRMQHNELQWIRMVLRTAYLVLGGRDEIREAGPSHAQCTAWIRSQRKYYRDSGTRELRNKVFYHRGAMIVGIVAAAVATIAAGLLGVDALWRLVWPIAPMKVVPFLDWVDAQSNWLNYTATIPYAFAGMVALLSRFYAEQRGFNENARRYQHMYVVFDDALRRLHRISKYGLGGDGCGLLEELGREALAEHANWLILHRERPFTFVHV